VRVRMVSWEMREGWEGFSAWARVWVTTPEVNARPPCWGRGPVQAGSTRRRTGDEKDLKDARDLRPGLGFMGFWFFEIYFCSHYVWGHRSCYLVHRGKMEDGRWKKGPRDHGPRDHRTTGLQDHGTALVERGITVAALRDRTAAGRSVRPIRQPEAGQRYAREPGAEFFSATRRVTD